MQLFLQTLLSGLTVGAIYALIALGFSLILGTLNVVDFSYGLYVLLAAYATYWSSVHVFTGGGIGAIVGSIAIAVLLTATCGSIVWGWALRRLLAGTHLSQLVGTMGVAAIGSGLLLATFGTDVVLTHFAPAKTVLNIGPLYVSAGRLAGGVIGLLAMAVFARLLRMRVGLMIRGIAMDAKGAAVVGIDVFRLRIVTVAVGAGLAGLAGGLLATFLPVGPSEGNRFLLIAFFTIAVGGLGSLRGALAGAFLIALVEVFSQTYLPNLVKNAVPYVFVGVFIALLPQGLGNVRQAFAGRLARA